MATRSYPGSKKKVLIALVFCILILLSVLLIYNPQFIKIVYYQKPEVDTFKEFPVREMDASTDTWLFPIDTSKSQSKLIESFLVKNGEGKNLQFSEYFEKGSLLAFLIIKDDTIVYEKYSRGFSRETLSNTFSIGKSMISILVGKAIDLGYIANTDQKIIEFLPEFENVPNFDKITIEDLLNMKSGLKFSRVGDGAISDLFSDEARLFYTSNLKRDLLKVEAETLPNTRWNYSNIDALILTWLLERATSMRVTDFFEEEIWKPVGAEFKGSWGIDQTNGLENSSSSFQCTAIDLAKIGRLYLHRGKRDSIQIISEKWIERSTIIEKNNLYNTAKGNQLSTHQYYWWLPQKDCTGDYSAEGLRGQRLYVNPMENVIIVQFANSGFGGYPYRTISKKVSDINFKR